MRGQFHGKGGRDRAGHEAISGLAVKMKQFRQIKGTDYTSTHSNHNPQTD